MTSHARLGNSPHRTGQIILSCICGEKGLAAGVKKYPPWTMTHDSEFSRSENAAACGLSLFWVILS